DGDQNRHERGNLIPLQRLKLLVLFLVQRAHEDLLEHVEAVDSGQNDAERGKQGKAEAKHRTTERTEQDGELADETVQTGQTHAAQRDDQADRAEERQRLPDAAKGVHVLGVATLVQDTDDREQTAGADAVVDHLENAALNTG